MKEKAPVAVVKTTPKTFFDDVKRVMDAANAPDHIINEAEIAIKLNLSWSKFFPSCSTHPYTFDAVMKALLSYGKDPKEIFSLENETVVTDIFKGIHANRWKSVLQKYHQKFIPLTDAEWVPVTIKRKTIALEKYFGKIEVPKAIIGKNILHLPTIKTHGHSMMTGALKNAFGLLLRKIRHQAHLVIHEVLVDLLMIQKEIARGLFTVTDGTIIGDGPGPRTMIPKEGNVLVASADLVAADAIQCVIMGLDPFAVKKLVLARKVGLGEMDPTKIEITGDFSSADELPVYPCNPGQSPVIKANRIMLKTPLRAIAHSHSKLFYIPILGSMWYHDYFWYPLIGKSLIKDFEKTSQWSPLLQNY